MNLYQAMGGAGSMKRLVDKRMANKDYAHLSYGGGAYVAQKSILFVHRGTLKTISEG